MGKPLQMAARRVKQLCLSPLPEAHGEGGLSKIKSGKVQQTQKRVTIPYFSL
jgi:hypothetical protein